jgi:hypothetical protein
MMKTFSELMCFGVAWVSIIMGTVMGCAAVGVSDGACFRYDEPFLGVLAAICFGFYLYLISARAGLKSGQSAWLQILRAAVVCFVSFFLGSMYEHISLPSMTAKVALLAAAALWIRVQWKAHFEK